MFAANTPKDRLVASAMDLAKTRPWRDLTLLEIATHAGVPLSEAAEEFQSKAQILAAFSGAVDQAVLERFPALGAETTRDRLFDVIVTRFEIMQPYKEALRAIIRDFRYNLGAGLSQLRTSLTSQYWMLTAAGLSGEGGMGLLRMKGLLGLYARVFPIWLDDDDAGLAKTMAALDKHLRRGESVMVRITNFKSGIARVCDAFTGKTDPKDDKQAASTAPAQEPSPPI